MAKAPFYIVFDGPPSHESGRFVEVETAEGKGRKAGEWKQREDGYWALGPFVEAAAVDLAENYIPAYRLEAYIQAVRATADSEPSAGALSGDPAPS